MVQEAIRKHRKRKKRIRRLLLAALAMVILVGILYVTVRVTDITVIGTHYIDSETVISLVFPEESDTHTLRILLRELLGKKNSVPVLDSLEISLTDPQTAVITVEESAPVGTIFYMGNYFLFNQEGYLLASSSTPVEGLPIVQGLTFEKLQLYEKLETGQEELFSQILILTQLLNQLDLSAEKIVFASETEVQLILNDSITVVLGECTQLEGKLSRLRDMESTLSGLSGTLHLENYDRNQENQRFLFEPSK